MIHQNVIYPKFNQFKAWDNLPMGGDGESPVVELSSERIFGLQNFILL